MRKFCALAPVVGFVLFLARPAKAATFYMVTPPFATPESVAPAAPLAHWLKEGSFDSAAKCEEVLQTIKRGSNQRRPSETPAIHKLFQAMVSAALCIAADDARLISPAKTRRSLLLIPLMPVSSAPGADLYFDDRAPLSKWHVDSSFADDAQCRVALRDARAHIAEEIRQHASPRSLDLGDPPPESFLAMTAAMDAAQCIDADDPRLK